MIPLAAFIFGLIIGSFLNVCIHRWPRDESVIKPRSRCPHCGTTIGWRDNVPLLSYFLLERRCRHCSEPISIRYPIVELLNGLFYAYLFARYGVEPMTFKIAVFTSMMLILIFTDLSDYILPDEITLGGLLLAFALIPFVPVEDRFTGLAWILSGEKPEQWIVSLVESGFAAVFIGGMLFVLRASYFRVRKSGRAWIGGREDDDDGRRFLGIRADRDHFDDGLDFGRGDGPSDCRDWTQEVVA